MATRREIRDSSGKQPDDVEMAVVDGGVETTPRLERLIHQPVRLGIASALVVNPTLSFNELKALLEVSDGNLSVHARKLEEAGYVECAKGYRDRVPRSEYRLTASGREALERYLRHMEALIGAIRER